MKKNFLIFWPFVLWPHLGWADREQIKVDPPSEHIQRQNNPHQSEVRQHPSGNLMADMFSRARGLKAFEVQTLHYNRVACERRLFTEAGASLEGDGDIKATNLGLDLSEVEFPTYIHLNSFNSVNPFGNGVESLETMTGRILVKTHPWANERPLLINKKLNIQMEDGSKKLVDSMTEIRVAEEGYVTNYIIKETVMLPTRFSIYFLCR